MRIPLSLAGLCLVMVILVCSVLFAVNTISASVGASLYIPHTPMIYVSFILLILTYWIFGGLYKMWLENW